MHILVVDDKQPIVEAVSRLLCSRGFTVDTASNGLAALEIATKNSFDLFIIDHLMPVMNGLQLVKNLKQRDVTCNVPVLFMTTQDVNSLTQLDEYALFDAIISKPIDEDLFYSAINQLLPTNSGVQSL